MSTAIDRRSFLIGAVAAIGVSPIGDAAAAGEGGRPRSRSRGREFLWGSAGASYQIEGGNVASDMWVMEHVKPSVFKEPSGDAADTYNRYEEDIKLAASLGFNAHRLSVEWSRIEPESGQISNSALAYYRRVFETVRGQGMKTVVTFNHYTTPRWFAGAGGFSIPEGVDPFVRFCTLVAERLGDVIDVASTFNEPNLPAMLAWSTGFKKLRPIFEASGKASAAAIGSTKWGVIPLTDWTVQQPIMIDAHNKACAAIRKATGGRVPVGVTLALSDERPGDDSNGAELKRAQYMDPWLQAEGDYVGVQTYTYSLVGADADLAAPAGVELTQMGYPFAPEALEAVIRTVAGRCKKPIYVTENGVATEDDARRIAYIDGAIKGLFNCMRDGIDVRGYMHWSLLDNWEWFYGYRPKFGLVAVDRTTFKRTPKPSAHHYGNIARRGLPADLRKHV